MKMFSLKTTMLLVLVIAFLGCHLVVADNDESCSFSMSNLLAELSDKSFKLALDEVAPYDEYLVDMVKCMKKESIPATSDEPIDKEGADDPLQPKPNPKPPTSTLTEATKEAIHQKVREHCSASYKINALINQYLLMQNLCTDMSTLRSKDLGSPVLNMLAGFTGLASAVVGFVFPPATLAIAALAMMSSAFWALDGMRNFKNNYTPKEQLQAVITLMESMKQNHDAIAAMSISCEAVTLDKIFGVEDDGDCNRYKQNMMDRICASYYNNGLPPVYFTDCNVDDSTFAEPHSAVDLIKVARHIGPYIFDASTQGKGYTVLKKLADNDLKLSSIFDDILAGAMPSKPQTERVVLMFPDADLPFVTLTNGTVNGKPVKVKQDISVCAVPSVMDELTMKDGGMLSKTVTKYHFFPKVIRDKDALMKANYLRIKTNDDCCSSWEKASLQDCFKRTAPTRGIFKRAKDYVMGTRAGIKQKTLKL